MSSTTQKTARERLTPFSGAKTSDGQVFESVEKAEEHEKGLIFHEEVEELVSSQLSSRESFDRDDITDFIVKNRVALCNLLT